MHCSGTTENHCISRLGRKLLGFALFLAAPVIAFAQTPLNPPLPTEIAEGAGIIVPGGTKWAIALGKAFFWDQQAGSDGQACASCHFVAGADTRLKNELNPGFDDVSVGVTPGGEISVGGDTKFGSQISDVGHILPGFMPSDHLAGPNIVLQPGDFPMHLLSDETVRDSPIITSTNDRISSQGVVDATFDFVRVMGQQDYCTNYNGSIFHVGNFASRQVEPRNTPTVINSALFNRVFWDGRANNTFNGVGVFGMRDINSNPNARLIVSANGTPELTYLTLENGALASQALGPPTNAVEMSCNGRTFPDVGNKLLSTAPLGLQKVSLTDSVLGSLANPAGNGLKQQYSYAAMIKKAFDPKWWSLPGNYKIVNGSLVGSGITGYTQMETNFSMFWGIAIMLYEASLISNQSEFDTLVAQGHISLAGGNCTPDSTVDPLLARGCQFFNTPPKGKGCRFCHDLPTFAEGANVAGTNVVPFVTVADVNGHIDLRDRGFANIGIRPAFTDQQSGRVDAYNNPLSYGRQYWAYQNAVANSDPNAPSYLLDPFLMNAVLTNNTGITAPPIKLETDGSSKIPSLRNVALTPPYFSWGGYANLRQVMVVYNRGISRRNVLDHGIGGFDAHGTSCLSGDDSGSGPDGNTPYANLVAGTQTDCNTNVSGLISPLGLSDCDAPIGTAPLAACVAQGVTDQNDDIAAFVRFFTSLTDPRVQCDAAPFDHPSLTVFNGQTNTDTKKYGVADDITFNFPAVGASGFSISSGFCIPNAGDLFAPGMQARSGGLKVTINTK